MGDFEPEAVIVDIEDIIEETASPMAGIQPQQTPVYSVTASETTSIAVPLGTITACHEPSPVILVEAGEIHHVRLDENTIFKRNDLRALSDQIYKCLDHCVNNMMFACSENSYRKFKAFLKHLYTYICLDKHSTLDLDHF